MLECILCNNKHNFYENLLPRLRNPATYLLAIKAYIHILLLYIFAGLSCYFFFMSAYLWLNVFCIDIWINFKNYDGSIKTKKIDIRFICYSIYAWGTASLATLTAMWAQRSPLVPEIYKPGLRSDKCWLDSELLIYISWRQRQ